MATSIQGDNIICPGQITIGLAPTSANHGVRNGDARLRFTGAYYVLTLDAQASAPVDLDVLTVPADYVPWKIMVINATDDHSGASLGLYTGAGGTGTEIVSPVALSNMTAAGKFQLLTIEALTDVLTATTLYPRLTVASSSAGTFDLIMWLHDLTDIHT